jgi:error-prone DNA polymerase
VTNVDPDRMSVLFERFISVERKEPPDIDVDFEHQRREEAMQYIYEKYGRDRAALTAVATTYRTKSALRDVGKAMGIDPDKIDRLANTAYGTDEKWISEACLLENEIDPADPMVVHWLTLADTIRGFPRHLSQHPGGFVIGRDKISRLVPAGGGQRRRPSSGAIAADTVRSVRRRWRRTLPSRPRAPRSAAPPSRPRVLRCGR